MTTDALSAKFAALADPTRRAILARLALGETSVSELAQPFSMSLPAVSKHLKVLERAGLIARGRAAQWRPCRIEPSAFLEVDAWLEHYRHFWDASLDRLDKYLSAMPDEEPAAPSAAESAAKSSADLEEGPAVDPRPRPTRKGK